jgi:serine/threonine protein kinase
MPTEFAADLDQWVASFENRWHATGKAVLSEHLPPRHHPLFERVLTELVCVDLEKHWEAGRRKRLDEYRYDFPELFANAELLQQAAFEEYRQRTQAGEPCTVEEYRLFAGIDTSNWPVQESLDGTIERPPTVIVQPTEIKHIEPAQLDELTDLRRSAPKLADRIHKAEEEFPDVGETFLGFELVSKIGQGSFAKVFLARQPQLADRLVALKVSALMLEEPRHLARMQHANIVPIYSVHCTKRLQAVCMPYLGAVTMSSVLEEMSSSGQIPQTGQAFLHTLYNNPSTLPYSTPSVKHMVAETPEVAESTRVSAPILEKLAQANHVETVLWLVARLADGLQHAHERDILHLDLKPANILLTDDGQPMLLDFNLSVEVAPESASEIARIGGTLPYMSPEQIESLRDNKFGVDARSDLFSLGVIFFEMITGQSPFIRRTGNRDKLLANMLADRTGPTPSARERNPAVPRAVDSILAKLLQPDRRHRYQTAAELREDIELQLSDRPLRHARDRSLGERFGKWRRRSPRLSTACLVGLAALVLLILPATAIAIRENQIAERNREIAVAEAKQMRFEVGKEAATIHVLLATLTGDRAQLSQGIERGQTVLDRYRIESNPNWFNESIVAHLPTEQQTQLRIELAEMLLLMADGQMILADDTPDRAAKKQQLEKALDWSRVAERCYPRDALPLGLVRQREQLRLKLPDLASSIDIPVGAVRSPEDSYRDGVAATMWGRHREAIEPLAEFAESHPKHFMARSAGAKRRVGEQLESVHRARARHAVGLLQSRIGAFSTGEFSGGER